MGDIQSGHGEVPRGQTFVLNDAFVEDVGDDGVRRYIEVLVEAEAYAADHGEADVETFLRERLEGTDLARPDHSYEITASLLKGSHGQISVVDNEGKVLYGRTDTAPDKLIPGVRGTEDPADPDRPFYS